MNLFKILRLECSAVGVELNDKSDALHEVARLAKQCAVFDHVSEEDIARGLEEREKIGTTGFGKGIAIPHCRLKEVSEFVMGIITVPEGVEFEALDGWKVHLIIFIVGPDRATSEHILILSIVSRTLNIPGVIDEILVQKNRESLYESFLRYSHDQVETGEREKKQLFHVFIQDEDLFKDILQIFEACESSSIAIIEGKNTREYLQSMPLFAGFWTDSYLGFNRIVAAIIDKSLTNEILRAIESLTGNLDQRNDIMVIVQDIFYTAGSLEA